MCWSAKAEPVPYAKLDNPQSLNLYAYVDNNPLSRADADGHFWQELKNWLTGNHWQTNAQVAANRTSITEIQGPGVAQANPVKQGYTDCKSSVNNTAAGKAINFVSPLALVPGVNPSSGETAQEWSEAIVSKGTALVGTGAISTPTDLTSLSGTTSIASPLESKVLPVLEKGESAAVPLTVVGTVVDAAISGSCFAGAVVNGVSTPPSNSVDMPDENNPASYGVN